MQAKKSVLDAIEEKYFFNIYGIQSKFTIAYNSKANGKIKKHIL